MKSCSTKTSIKKTSFTFFPELVLFTFFYFSLAFVTSLLFRGNKLPNIQLIATNSSLRVKVCFPSQHKDWHFGIAQDVEAKYTISASLL